MECITESVSAFGQDEATDEEYLDLLGDDRQVERPWGDDEDYDWECS